MLWQDLQFNVDSERQIFEKLFMANLFTLRIFLRNLLRGSRRKKILPARPRRLLILHNVVWNTEVLFVYHNPLLSKYLVYDIVTITMGGKRPLNNNITETKVSTFVWETSLLEGYKGWARYGFKFEPSFISNLAILMSFYFVSKFSMLSSLIVMNRFIGNLGQKEIARWCQFC